MFDYIPNFLEI